MTTPPTSAQRHLNVRPGDRIEYHHKTDVPDMAPCVGSVWALGPFDGQAWVLPLGLETMPRQRDAVQVCLECGFATDRRCCS